jgi:kumamolisin
MATIPDGYRRVEGSERRPARGARRVAPSEPNEKFSFTIRVRRRPDAPPVPDQNFWAANPPGTRQFLSPEELVARSGAAQGDLDKVAEFARSQGFEVVGTSTARRTVRLSGTVAQASTAFAVDLARYESPEQTYRGREGYVHLPAEIADVVEGVFGLDNRRMARRSAIPAGAVFVKPAQIAQLYDFPPLFAAGQTVGILEFGGGFSQSDLNQFCAAQMPPIPAPTPTIVSVDGQSTTPGSAASPNPADGEVALDVQVVAAIAQGANIVMFFAPFSDDGWIDAVTTAIYESPLRLTSLTVSWGQSEDQWDSGTMNSLDIAFAEASLLGITIFSGSGDFGSNNQDNDGNAHVEFPASDPWVTACGGTFTANPTSKPFKEGTWNDNSGATGGGVSALPPVSSGGTGFTVPPWQAGLTVTLLGAATPSPLTGRGVPDIAGNASPFSGYPIVLYGETTPNGGTSAVGPLYAALMAIIAAKTGWPLGFLNPLLYQIGGTPGQTALVPIDDGGNNELISGFVLPNGDTAEACPAYVAPPTPGWNACTGWGRIDGNALLKVLVPLEETRPIDDEHPFSFGAGGEWLYHNDGGGSSSSGNSINAGQMNTANIYDCTYVYNNAPNNAVFVADNQSAGNGAVGLFGRSRGSSWSIGVAGECVNGSAVYGIATGEVASQGIGVVGRSMNGIATETLPLEQVVGAPIGVLGHSEVGPGVRGHGGVLLKQPQAGLTLAPQLAAPGGVFSSGRLQDQSLSYIFPSDTPQTVSLDALPQARLVPSVAAQHINDVVKPELPVVGQVGDLFLLVPPLQSPVQSSAGFFGSAQLYVCTAVVPERGDVANPAGPRWQEVQLGTALLPGGPIS